MSSKNANEDLRCVKTKKVLYVTMSSLLKSHSFRKITIKEICEEAIISRATFYTHFIDKYDLLKHWLPELWPQNFSSSDSYEQIERAVNCHVRESMLMIKSLILDADEETIGIVFDFIISTIQLTTEKGHEERYMKNIVLSNFYAGGLISYLLWQVKNKFPADVPPMNRYLYEIMHQLQDFQAQKEESEVRK